MSLRPREREVLALLSQGLRRREIAARLGLSVSTVGGYIASIRLHTKGERVDAELDEAMGGDWWRDEPTASKGE